MVCIVHICDPLLCDQSLCFQSLKIVKMCHCFFMPLSFFPASRGSTAFFDFRVRSCNGGLTLKTIKFIDCRIQSRTGIGLQFTNDKIDRRKIPKTIFDVKVRIDFL